MKTWRVLVTAGITRWFPRAPLVSLLFVHPALVSFHTQTLPCLQLGAYFSSFPTSSSCASCPAAAAAAAKSLQSCPTLCDPIDGSPPGSPVHRILQARTLEWIAFPFSNACMHAKSLQSCLTLCNPMDSSPPGSSVHRILQARTLEWGAIPFSIMSS